MQPTDLTTDEILTRRFFVDRWGHAIMSLAGHPCASPKGMVRRARVVAYNAGLLTDLSLIVHHKDGNKLNDVPDNFEIMRAGAHSRHHMLGNKLFLGKTHTPEVRQRIAAKNTGKKRSAEWCAHLSRALTGRRLTAEQREQRKQTALRGEQHPNWGRHYQMKCGICKAEGHNVRTHATHAVQAHVGG